MDYSKQGLFEIICYGLFEIICLNFLRLFVDYLWSICCELFVDYLKVETGII